MCSHPKQFALHPSEEDNVVNTRILAIGSCFLSPWKKNPAYEWQTSRGHVCKPRTTALLQRNTLKVGKTFANIQLATKFTCLKEDRVLLEHCQGRFWFVVLVWKPRTLDQNLENIIILKVKLGQVSKVSSIQGCPLREVFIVVEHPGKED